MSRADRGHRCEAAGQEGLLRERERVREDGREMEIHKQSLELSFRVQTFKEVSCCVGDTAGGDQEKCSGSSG